MQVQVEIKYKDILDYGGLTVTAPPAESGTVGFLSVTADPPSQCCPFRRLLQQRRIIHLTNKAGVPLSVMGVLVPDDAEAVIQQLITKISVATPAAEVKAVSERIAPTCPDALQFNTISVDNDIDLPVGPGAKGMQLYVYNNDNEDEMFWRCICTVWIRSHSDWSTSQQSLA